MKVIETIQLAKANSKHFYRYLTVVENGGSYYWCDHNGGIPNKTKDMKVLTKEEANLILEVISDYKANKKLFTGGYSWLLIGCHYKGLNLVKRGFMAL